MEKTLTIRDLRISFQASSGTVRAVRGVDLDLYQGETLAIVGESGSGKSVTVKAIMGIVSSNQIVEGGTIIGALRSEIRVPFGVDAISDGAACLELAAAVGASYVRGTFSGVYVGDGGLYNNDFSALLRRKAALPLDDLKMLYFINPESDRNLDTRPLADIAASTMSKAAPDGLCISANAAGMDVDEELIASVKTSNPGVVVLCNTGCRPDTIVRKLQAGDAAVVGTYFKENGKLENSRHENVRVDLERVREFMAVVYRFRETL